MLCAHTGANVHAGDDDALSWAERNGHAGIVEMLCARFGANVQVRQQSVAGKQTSRGQEEMWNGILLLRLLNTQGSGGNVKQHLIAKNC